MDEICASIFDPAPKPKELWFCCIDSLCAVKRHFKVYLLNMFLQLILDFRFYILTGTRVSGSLYC